MGFCLFLLQFGLEGVNEHDLPKCFKDLNVTNYIILYRYGWEIEISPKLKKILDDALDLIFEENMIAFATNHLTRDEANIDEANRAEAKRVQFYDVISDITITKNLLEIFVSDCAHRIRHLYVDMTNETYTNTLRDIMLLRSAKANTPILETLIVRKASLTTYYRVAGRLSKELEVHKGYKIEANKFELTVAPIFYTQINNWLSTVTVHEEFIGHCILPGKEPGRAYSKAEGNVYTHPIVEIYLPLTKGYKDVLPFLNEHVTTMGLSPDIVLPSVEEILNLTRNLAVWRIRFSIWSAYFENDEIFSELEILYMKEGVVIVIIAHISEIGQMDEILARLAVIPNKREDHRFERHYTIDAHAFSNRRKTDTLETAK